MRPGLVFSSLIWELIPRNRSGRLGSMKQGRGKASWLKDVALSWSPLGGTEFHPPRTLREAIEYHFRNVYLRDRRRRVKSIGSCPSLVKVFLSGSWLPCTPRLPMCERWPVSWGICIAQQDASWGKLVAAVMTGGRVGLRSCKLGTRCDQLHSFLFSDTFLKPGLTFWIVLQVPHQSVSFTESKDLRA